MFLLLAEGILSRRPPYFVLRKKGFQYLFLQTNPMIYLQL